MIEEDDGAEFYFAVLVLLVLERCVDSHHYSQLMENWVDV
jgi:hypothetical protein